MHHVRASLAFLLLVCSTASFAGETVTGSLTANGKTVALKHAYARSRKDPFDKKKTAVLLIVTDQELSPAAADDDIELMTAQDKQALTGFTALINDEKRIVSGTVFSPAFKKMKQFSAVGMQTAELTAMTASRLAGTVALPKPDDFFGEKYQYTATFDLPITKPAPEAVPVLKGKPLPAGGGDPGKAYAAYLKMMASGDMKAFLAGVTAERAQQASSDPDFKKMFPLLKVMQPTSIKVSGGSIDGETATLLATGKDGDNVSHGTITMAREKGSWKVAREEWKTRSE